MSASFLSIDLHWAYIGAALDAAEFCHGFFDGLHGCFYVLVGGEDGEGDAEAAFGLKGGDSHGGLDVRGLLFPGHTGATGGALDAVFIE